MGYHVGIFVESVDQNIICSICSAVLEEAVLTPCGHSFCSLCLDTWLFRPRASTTCPECRTPMNLSDIHPIHALRNIVNSLSIVCENKERGCDTSLKVETLKTHILTCDFVPLGCAGCGSFINRKDMADHQLNCEIIQSIILEEETQKTILEDAKFSQDQESSPTVEQLAVRLVSFESELKNVRKELHLADHRNKQLEKELRKTRKNLEEKREQLLGSGQQFVEFDPDYDYGYTPDSILKLTSFISKFLNRKPNYVDNSRIFGAVKRCFDNYGHDHRHTDEIHMLLATAYASNWFSRSQRVYMNCWVKLIIE